MGEWEGGGGMGERFHCYCCGSNAVELLLLLDDRGGRAILVPLLICHSGLVPHSPSPSYTTAFDTALLESL